MITLLVNHIEIVSEIGRLNCEDTTKILLEVVGAAVLLVQIAKNRYDPFERSEQTLSNRRFGFNGRRPAA